MKIWIDDIRNAPDDSWNVCRTVQSAIKAMHQFSTEITDISFDHDISHQVGIGVGVPRPMPCSETFQSAAHFLGLLAERHEQMIILNKGEALPWIFSISIHSANPVGAQEIANILRGYGLNPSIEALPQANRLESIL